MHIHQTLKTVPPAHHGGTAWMDHVTSSDFSVLATLSVTAGSISLVFFIFCVEQLTNLARRAGNAPHVEEEETARFHAAKYLAALLVIGICTADYLGTGVLSMLRVANKAPHDLNITIGTGITLFAYASWCMTVLVIVLTTFEARLARGEILLARGD